MTTPHNSGPPGVNFKTRKSKIGISIVPKVALAALIGILYTGFEHGTGSDQTPTWAVIYVALSFFLGDMEAISFFLFSVLLGPETHVKSQFSELKMPLLSYSVMRIFEGFIGFLNRKFSSIPGLLVVFLLTYFNIGSVSPDCATLYVWLVWVPLMWIMWRSFPRMSLLTVLIYVSITCYMSVSWYAFAVNLFSASFVNICFSRSVKALDTDPVTFGASILRFGMFASSLISAYHVICPSNVIRIITFLSSVTVYMTMIEAGSADTQGLGEVYSVDSSQLLSRVPFHEAILISLFSYFPQVVTSNLVSRLTTSSYVSHLVRVSRNLRADPTSVMWFPFAVAMSHFKHSFGFGSIYSMGKIKLLLRICIPLYCSTLPGGGKTIRMMSAVLFAMSDSVSAVAVCLVAAFTANMNLTAISDEAVTIQAFVGWLAFLAVASLSWMFGYFFVMFVTSLPSKSNWLDTLSFLLVGAGLLTFIMVDRNPSMFLRILCETFPMLEPFQVLYYSPIYWLVFRWGASVAEMHKLDTRNSYASRVLKSGSIFVFSALSVWYLTKPNSEKAAVFVLDTTIVLSIGAILLLAQLKMAAENCVVEDIVTSSVHFKSLMSARHTWGMTQLNLGMLDPYRAHAREESRENENSDTNVLNVPIGIDSRTETFVDESDDAAVKVNHKVETNSENVAAATKRSEKVKSSYTSSGATMTFDASNVSFQTYTGVPSHEPAWAADARRDIRIIDSPRARATAYFRRHNGPVPEECLEVPNLACYLLGCLAYAVSPIPGGSIYRDICMYVIGRYSHYFPYSIQEMPNAVEDDRIRAKREALTDRFNGRTWDCDVDTIQAFHLDPVSLIYLRIIKGSNGLVVQWPFWTTVRNLVILAMWTSLVRQSLRVSILWNFSWLAFRLPEGVLPMFFEDWFNTAYILVAYFITITAVVLVAIGVLMLPLSLILFSFRALYAFLPMVIVAKQLTPKDFVDYVKARTSKEVYVDVAGVPKLNTTGFQIGLCDCGASVSDMASYMYVYGPGVYCAHSVMCHKKPAGSHLRVDVADPVAMGEEPAKPGLAPTLSSQLGPDKSMANYTGLFVSPSVKEEPIRVEDTQDYSSFMLVIGKVIFCVFLLAASEVNTWSSPVLLVVAALGMFCHSVISRNFNIFNGHRDLPSLAAAQRGRPTALFFAMETPEPSNWLPVVSSLVDHLIPMVGMMAVVVESTKVDIRGLEVVQVELSNLVNAIVYNDGPTEFIRMLKMIPARLWENPFSKWQLSLDDPIADLQIVKEVLEFTTEFLKPIDEIKVKIGGVEQKPYIPISPFCSHQRGPQVEIEVVQSVQALLESRLGRGYFQIVKCPPVFGFSSLGVPQECSYWQSAILRKFSETIPGDTYVCTGLKSPTPDRTNTQNQYDRTFSVVHNKPLPDRLAPGVILFLYTVWDKPIRLEERVPTSEAIKNKSAAVNPEFGRFNNILEVFTSSQAWTYINNSIFDMMRGHFAINLLGDFRKEEVLPSREVPDLVAGFPYFNAKRICRVIRICSPVHFFLSLVVKAFSDAKKERYIHNQEYCTGGANPNDNNRTISALLNHYYPKGKVYGIADDLSRIDSRHTGQSLFFFIWVAFCVVRWVSGFGYVVVLIMAVQLIFKGDVIGSWIYVTVGILPSGSGLTSVINTMKRKVLSYTMLWERIVKYEGLYRRYASALGVKSDDSIPLLVLACSMHRSGKRVEVWCCGDDNKMTAEGGAGARFRMRVELDGVDTPFRDRFVVSVKDQSSGLVTGAKPKTSSNSSMKVDMAMFFGLHTNIAGITIEPLDQSILDAVGDVQSVLDTGEEEKLPFLQVWFQRGSDGRWFPHCDLKKVLANVSFINVVSEQFDFLKNFVRSPEMLTEMATAENRTLFQRIYEKFIPSKHRYIDPVVAIGDVLNKLSSVCLAKTPQSYVMWRLVSEFTSRLDSDTNQIFINNSFYHHADLGTYSHQGYLTAEKLKSLVEKSGFRVGDFDDTAPWGGKEAFESELKGLMFEVDFALSGKKKQDLGGMTCAIIGEMGSGKTAAMLDEYQRTGGTAILTAPTALVVRQHKEAAQNRGIDVNVLQKAIVTSESHSNLKIGSLNICTPEIAIKLFPQTSRDMTIFIDEAWSREAFRVYEVYKDKCRVVMVTDDKKTCDEFKTIKFDSKLYLKPGKLGSNKTVTKHVVRPSSLMNDMFKVVQKIVERPGGIGDDYVLIRLPDVGVVDKMALIISTIHSKTFKMSRAGSFMWNGLSWIPSEKVPKGSVVVATDSLNAGFSLPGNGTLLCFMYSKETRGLLNRDMRIIPIPEEVYYQVTGRIRGHRDVHEFYVNEPYPSAFVLDEDPADAWLLSDERLGPASSFMEGGHIGLLKFLSLVSSFLLINKPDLGQDLVVLEPFIAFIVEYSRNPRGCLSSLGKYRTNTCMISKIFSAHSSYNYVARQKSGIRVVSPLDLRGLTELDFRIAESKAVDFWWESMGRSVTKCEADGVRVVRPIGIQNQISITKGGRDAVIRTIPVSFKAMPKASTMLQNIAATLREW